MSATANRVIKNTGFLYAKMGITMFISLYTTRLILNSLGASDFGIFNIVGGAIAMLGFLNASMAGATQRFMSFSEGEGNKEKQKSIFNISIVLHTAIAVMVGVLLLVAGYFFFNGILNIPADRMDAAKVVYGSLIISTMFTVMTVPYDAVMNAHENMKYYAIVGIFESFLKLTVAFICVYTSHDKLIVYGILMACVPLITLTIMRIYCHHHYEECVLSPRKYYDKRMMREMTGFAGWNFLSAAASMVCNYGQGIIINHFFGTLLNAAQGIANQVNGQLQVFSYNLIKAVNPVLGKSAGAQDLRLMHKMVIESARISNLLYAVFAIPMFVYSPYILKLWLKEYPDWTVTFVRFALVLSYIDYLMSPVVQAVRSVGIIKYMTRWTCIVNFMPLVVVPILFYNDMEPHVFYIVLIIAKLIIFEVVLLNADKYCQLKQSDFVIKVLMPSFTFALMFCGALYILASFCDYNSIPGLLTHLLVYVVLFSLSMSVYLNKTEKKLLNNLFLKIVK